MGSIQKQYTKEIRKRFGGYYATWTPDVPLKLGDIGLLNDNVFKRIDNLENLGIPFSIHRDNTKSSLEHASQGSVSQTFKLAGQAAPQGSMLKDADAGIIVDFLRERSVLFKINNVTSSSIDGIIGLGERILEMYHQKKWNKEWVLITELKEAESGTVLISNSSNGRIELKANVDVGAQVLDIADASLNLSVQRSKNMDVKIIANENLTPLFQLTAISKGGLKYCGKSTEISLPKEEEEYIFEQIFDEDWE